MSVEQQQWLVKASDNLEAAKLLSDNGLYDAAISRGYYAMFQVANAFLLEDNLRLNRHSAVISAFGLRFTRVERVPTEFHRILIEGQVRRNAADYSPEHRSSEEAARQQIHGAARFLELAERLIGTPTNEDS